MEEAELRRLAQEARRKLPDLIPDKIEQQQADRELARALNEPPGVAKSALMDALVSYEGLRRWVAVDVDRSVGMLGEVTSPIGVLYACPHRDYTVVRDVPPDGDLLCPNDGSVLARYSG